MRKIIKPKVDYDKEIKDLIQLHLDRAADARALEIAEEMETNAREWESAGRMEEAGPLYSAAQSIREKYKLN